MKKLLFTIPLLFIWQSALASITITYYPDPNVEVTSVDGYVGRQVGYESWASLHDSAGNQANDSSALILAQLECAGCSSPNFNDMFAGIMHFDTSSINDTDTIDSATVSVYGTSGTADGFNADVALTNSLVADGTSLATSDYLNRGTTDCGTSRLDLGTWNTAGYNTWTVSAGCLTSTISKTARSKFGFEMSFDVDNTAPTWANNNASARGDSADTAGTANDPKLTITMSSTSAATVSPKSPDSAWW